MAPYLVSTSIYIADKRLRAAVKLLQPGETLPVVDSPEDADVIVSVEADGRPHSHLLPCASCQVITHYRKTKPCVWCGRIRTTDPEMSR